MNAHLPQRIQYVLRRVKLPHVRQRFDIRHDLRQLCIRLHQIRTFRGGFLIHILRTLIGHRFARVVDKQNRQARARQFQNLSGAIRLQRILIQQHRLIRRSIGLQRFPGPSDMVRIL